MAQANEFGSALRHPYRGPWRGLEDLELATLEWVDWFNRRRLHQTRMHLHQKHQTRFLPQMTSH